MLKSYRVVVSYSVLNDSGSRFGNYYYSEIHHKVIRTRQAYEEAVERIIQSSEEKFGKNCRIEFTSDFRFLNPQEPDKSLRTLAKVPDPEKMKQQKMFKSLVTDKEKKIVEEARGKIYSRSLLVRRTRWDLLKDEMTNEQIEAIKESPYEPEKHWALIELKRRFKEIYDNMQLKLFP